MKVVALLFMLVCSVAGWAQDYYVLQVKGLVKTKSGAVLKSNDLVKPDERLVFSSADDALAVVNSKSGRFIIKPKREQGSGEFIAIVKDATTPGIKRLSTRSGSINNVIDFQALFSERVLLLDTMRVKISLTGFPMNENSFFFVRYELNGEEINKKLAFRADTLLIGRDQLYSVDGKPINPAETKQMKLFHLDNGNAHFISELKFNNPDLTKLAKEMLALKKTLDSKKHNVLEESYLYSVEFYGSVSHPDFVRWYTTCKL